jgi:Uma2 family endonuclease
MSTIAAPPNVYSHLPPDQPWPAQGHWTYADYLRLPDDGIRYEMIAGVLYMANAPDPEHQYAVGEIFGELREHVKANQLGVVYTAPIEVHLPGIGQPVQPDVLFIAQSRRDIPKDKFIEDAPDRVVEVTSASTARLDRKVKLDAYKQAGVREYWIANPRTRFVEVYALQPGEYVLRSEHGPGERLDSGGLPGLTALTDVLFAT